MQEGYQWKEEGWVTLEDDLLYVTFKYSNQLTLDQWAFENVLPLFWYTLYIDLRKISNFTLKKAQVSKNVLHNFK